MLVLLASGCAYWPHHGQKEPVAILRVHLESETTAAGSNKTVSVMREQPVSISISSDPILTEADVIGARLLDTGGGAFVIEIKLEETAGWRLEQYTAGNPGKHLVIFAQWSENKADGRWLAAPLISRRMAGDTLTFTPDASREEARKLVDGLNFVAKKNAGMKSKE